MRAIWARPDLGGMTRSRLRPDRAQLIPHGTSSLGTALISDSLEGAER